MWPDDRIIGLVEKEFVPVRVHVREQADAFQRLGERYGAHWTPTTLVLDPEGAERHRVEGFLPVDELLPQLRLGLGHVAFQRGQWDDAARHFEVIVERYPRSDVAPEAVYWSGVARYKATNDAAMLGATARRLTAEYRDSVWAKKASVWG